MLDLDLSRARRRPGRDRHRMPRGRRAQPRPAGCAAPRRFVRAAERGTRVRAHARRQLPFADRGARVARRHDAHAARLRRRARRQRGVPRQHQRLRGRRGRARPRSSRAACRRQERASCSNACAARPAPSRDAAAGRTRRRRHEAGPPGCAIHRNADGTRRGCGSVSDRRHRARAARRRRPCGARRAADRLGHLHERERRGAGARADGPAGACSDRGHRPGHRTRRRSRGVSRRRDSRDGRGFRGLAGAPCVRRTLGPAHRDLQGRRWTRRAARRARASRCSGCRRRGLPPPAGRAGRRFACRSWPTPAPPDRSWSQSRASRSWSRCCSSRPSHGYRTSRTRPCSCPANALRRRHAGTAGADRSSWPAVPRTRRCSMHSSTGGQPAARPRLRDTIRA